MANKDNNILRFKRFKDMKDWSPYDTSKFEFPKHTYKDQNTPLLSFLEEKGFEVNVGFVNDAKSYPGKHNAVGRYPQDTGNRFHIQIEHPNDDVMGGESIDFYTFFEISPHQQSDRQFKELCLKYAKDEYVNMLKSKVVENIGDKWDYHSNDFNNNTEQFIEFLNLQRININSNKKIVHIPDIDERLYRSSKVIGRIEEYNLINILREFMSL